MIRSMTAFARCERSGDWGRLTWELRSVNHRYLELYPKLPEQFRSLEPQIRDRCASRLGRGKLELGLKFQAAAGTQRALTLNRNFAAELVAVATEVGDILGTGGKLSVSDVLSWPGVVAEAEMDVEPVSAVALAVLDDALTELVETREREGGKIREFIEQRCTRMSELVDKAWTRRPQMLSQLREKLETRLAELAVSADPGRLEQEMVLTAQKLDVDEEMDRLDTHIEELGRVLGRSEPVGRRLDFLLQELNREANTLASKSLDAESTALAVDLKVLIEQIREQIQNVE